MTKDRPSASVHEQPGKTDLSKAVNPPHAVDAALHFQPPFRQRVTWPKNGNAHCGLEAATRGEQLVELRSLSRTGDVMSFNVFVPQAEMVRVALMFMQISGDPMLASLAGALEQKHEQREADI